MLRLLNVATPVDELTATGVPPLANVALLGFVVIAIEIDGDDPMYVFPYASSSVTATGNTVPAAVLPFNAGCVLNTSFAALACVTEMAVLTAEVNPLDAAVSV